MQEIGRGATGMVYRARHTLLRRPARLGYAAPIGKMPETLAEPEFACVVGLTQYAHRTRLARGTQEEGITSKLKALFAKRSN